MTRKLDLRAGRPVWMTYRAPRVATQRMARAMSCDVAVVGMGISGAMIADEASAAGHDVVLVDRRGPVLGSTPATTALVQFEIDQPLSVLSGMIGRDRAERAWRRSRLAVANLAARIEALGLACDLQDKQALYLSGNRLGPGALRREAAARRAAGLAASYLPRGELVERFGIDRPGAIVSPGNLALDPRKMTSGLLLAAERRGARLLAPVEATGFRSRGGGVDLFTRDGPTLHCRHLVLATGYELMTGVPDKGHSVISTWAMATARQPGALWPGAALIWEASDPYLYLRETADGRVICGGEDEAFADEARRDAATEAKTKRIARKLTRLLPHLDTRPEFAWAGAFGTTARGLPIIARLPRHRRVHAVMGYGGNGITWSRIAAELVRTHVEGGRDTDTDLFDWP